MMFLASTVSRTMYNILHLVSDMGMARPDPATSAILRKWEDIFFPEAAEMKDKAQNIADPITNTGATIAQVQLARSNLNLCKNLYYMIQGIYVKHPEKLKSKFQQLGDVVTLMVFTWCIMSHNPDNLNKT